MNKHDRALLMAAVAGIGLGLSAPVPGLAQYKKGDTRCWGINACKSTAKCSVAADDISAFQELLGEKDFQDRFGKTETHSCGSHATCGAAQKVLNWVPTNLQICKAKSGYLVEEVGTPKKKVAKKA